MPSPPPEIIDRIKKLRQLAQNTGSFEGEAANAIAAIEKLKQKYDITEADLASHDEQFRIGIESGVAIPVGELFEWAKALTSIPADIFGVVPFTYDGHLNESDGQRCLGVSFLGCGTDPKLALELYQVLRDTIVSMAWSLFGEDCWDIRHSSYAQGCAGGLAERLMYIRRQRALYDMLDQALKRQSADAKALAVIKDKKKAKIEAAVEELRRQKEALGGTVHEYQFKTLDGLDYQAFMMGERDSRDIPLFKEIE